MHLADKKSAVIIEVNPTKQHLEIINWHYLSREALERKKDKPSRRGRILTLSEDNAAADTHDSLSSDDKGNTLSSDEQGMGEESSPQENSHEEKPDKPAGKKPRKKKKKAEEGEMSAEEFEDAFNSLNAGDAATEALGKRVLPHYAPGKNRIELNAEKFNSVRLGDETKAQCMVHEMIHAVTCWAMHMAKENPAALTESQLAAVRDIEAVYEAIKDDGAVRAALRTGTRVEDNAEYGLTSAEEMIAELANPAFRAVLKAKQLFRQLINGVKRLLGIDVTGSSDRTDAAAVLEGALETLLNEFDQDVYRDYTDLAAMGHARETFDMQMAGEDANPLIEGERRLAEELSRNENTRGIVMLGLSETSFEIVHMTGEHPFSIDNSVTHFDLTEFKKEVTQWAEENGLICELSNEESGGKGTISISKNSIKEMMDKKTFEKSDNRDFHFAVLTHLKEIIKKAKLAETQPFLNKNKVTGERGEAGSNTGLIVHRLYAAVEIDGKLYRVKLTLRKVKSDNQTKAYSYQINDIEKIELLQGQTNKIHKGTLLRAVSNSISGAKLLTGVGKSHENNKPLLDESAELRLPEENQSSTEDEPEENGRADTTLARQGTGEKTADDVAQAADLWTKAWGPDARTPAQRRRFAREERRRMRARAESIADPSPWPNATRWNAASKWTTMGLSARRPNSSSVCLSADKVFKPIIYLNAGAVSSLFSGKGGNVSSARSYWSIIL